MDYAFIKTERQLAEYCHALSAAKVIAFDTEFVSEDSYLPHLCLVQIASDIQPELAVIDPIEVGDLSPFWKVIAAPGHETIVHAGREEVRFCLLSAAKPPVGLVDIQIAAGLVGHEYPAGYSNLIFRVLGHSLSKHETRTDWRRRPLSEQQLSYALDDVRYLVELRGRLGDRLAELGRTSWLDDEMTAWLEEIDSSLRNERWRRVSGSSSMSSRNLAVVRELWRWRESEAKKRDLPPRRVLRDDLLVELARRRTTDPRQIRALRGMERRDLQRSLPDIADSIARAMELPSQECPRPAPKEVSAQHTVACQVLTAALGSVCRAANVAPSIVGTVADVRDLVAWHLGENRQDEPPALTKGWRATLVGSVLTDLLDGKRTIRIQNPRSDDPLRFESVE